MQASQEAQTTSNSHCPRVQVHRIPRHTLTYLLLVNGLS